jgi:hypothetical protein
MYKFAFYLISAFLKAIDTDLLLAGTCNGSNSSTKLTSLQMFVPLEDALNVHPKALVHVFYAY